MQQEFLLPEPLEPRVIGLLQRPGHYVDLPVLLVLQSVEPSLQHTDQDVVDQAVNHPAKSAASVGLRAPCLVRDGK